MSGSHTSGYVKILLAQISLQINRKRKVVIEMNIFVSVYKFVQSWRYQRFIQAYIIVILLCNLVKISEGPGHCHVFLLKLNVALAKQQQQ